MGVRTLWENPLVTLFERVEADMMDARRRRDELAVNTLGMLKSEVVKATKEPGAPAADDQLVVRVLRREVKRREEAAEAYRAAGRAETAATEGREADILRAYLPAAMTPDEVEAVVRQVAADLAPSGPGAFGMVMKEATRRLAGRAEGAQVAAAAKRVLGQA